MVTGLEHMLYKKLRELGSFSLEKQGLSRRNPLSLQQPKGGVTKGIIFKLVQGEVNMQQP